jgi:dihydroorotase
VKTLIKNATVVLPQGLAQTNVLIEDEKIARIDPAVQTRADEVIDATGLHLLPGVIDDQVHFREPGLTHKEDLRTATRACAKGGVTTFLEMPNTVPTTTTQARLEEKLALAAGKCLVNYGFYVGATPHNLDELRRAHRTPGIKIFLGSSTGDLLVDDQDALERIFAETTLPITAHCEDETTIRRNRERIGPTSDVADHSRIRDVEAAVVATRRAIDLALRHRHPFHVLHVSTGAEAKLLGELRKAEPAAVDSLLDVGRSTLDVGRSAPESERPTSNVQRPTWNRVDDLITAEVCPHHLFFNIDDYPRLGTRVQMNPSLKTADDNARLWKALEMGDIQVIATDHAPHTLEEKAKPFPQAPSGLPAVENSLALMLNEVNRGRITLSDVVEWMSSAPARVWNIAGKGRIAKGYDADLVLVDLELSRTVRDEEQETKCRWSPWHGVTLTGWPVRTWVLGREVYRQGRIDDSVRGGEARFGLVEKRRS